MQLMCCMLTSNTKTKSLVAICFSCPQTCSLRGFVWQGEAVLLATWRPGRLTFTCLQTLKRSERRWLKVSKHTHIRVKSSLCIFYLRMKDVWYLTRNPYYQTGLEKSQTQVVSDHIQDTTFIWNIRNLVIHLSVNMTQIQSLYLSNF